MSDLKPKICIVSTTPLVVHFFLMPLIRELSVLARVTVVYNDHLDSYLGPLSLPVQRIHAPIERKISLFKDLVALISIAKIFKREAFDMVVTVAPKAGLLGMSASFVSRIPIRLHIFQGEVWATSRGLVRYLLKFVDSLTARFATNILAVSKSEKRFLEAQHVVSDGRIRVLGPGSICGVDTERFKPDGRARRVVREELGIPEDDIVCLYVGRIARDKGLADLVRAFMLSAAARPKLWLLIAGPDEDSMEKSLRALLPEALADRVVFSGFVHAPERYLAAADFLCLPSYREGFGNVIIEAAAAGLPSLGTRIYGIMDAIQDNQTGLLVSVGDVQALSAAISKWTDDPDSRKRYAHEAYKRAHDCFEQAKIVQQYRDYFMTLVNSCKRMGRQ